MGHSKIITRSTPMVRKQMGQMAKLFGLWENSKLKDATQRKVNPEPTMRDGAPDFMSQCRGIRTRHVTRRQIVLNRHFTEIISDVLAINFSAELNKLDISITSIETKAWNKGVRIYYSRLGKYDENVHLSLMKLEPDLRYVISQRRLLGRVPQVSFVYDNTIRFDQSLDEALEKVSLNSRPEEEVKDLANAASATHLYIVKDLGDQAERLVSKKFSAPRDMNNNMFGLDYAKLYDEAAITLVRGRGESSRLATNKTFLTSAKPLFRDTHVPSVEKDDDPVKRLSSMRNFIISQKLKAEHRYKVRRREEILATSKNKWEQPDLNQDAKVAPDIVEGQEDENKQE